MAVVRDIAPTNGGPAILDRLHKVRRENGGWKACCPAHEDRTPSLSVSWGQDGRTLLKCFAGCTHEDILSALDMTETELFAPKERNGNGHQKRDTLKELVATYNYFDSSDTLQFQKLRYRTSEGKTFVVRCPSESGKEWIYKDVFDHATRILYKTQEVNDAKERGDLVLLVEGEKDVETAERLGFTATTNYEGAAKPDQSPKWRDEYTEQLRGVTVYLIADNDDSGRAHMQHAAKCLKGVAASVRMLELPNLPTKGDLTDWFKAGGTREQLQALIDAAPEWTPAAVPQKSVEPLPANVVTLDAVQMLAIQWLWWGRLARGKITVLDSDPGKGKSTITLDIAARISRGMPFPNEALPCDIGRVALLSYEDSLSDTIRPRLEAAGADLSRVTAITGIPCEDGTERPVVIPNDLPLISPLLDGVDLLIIDPLSAALSGQIDGNKDTDVRRALHVLKNLAEERNLAILIVRHLNKSGGGNALYRGGGSIGIIGAARIGLLVAEHPEDADQRVLAVSKCNLARHAPSLSYRITEHQGLKAPMIDWTGTVDKSANDLLADNRPSPALADAIAFLEAELASGARTASELYDGAEGNGISIPTLKKAKKRLGVQTAKEHKKGGKWTWFLKGDQQSPTITDDPLDPLDPLQTTKGDQGDQEDQGLFVNEGDPLHGEAAP